DAEIFGLDNDFDLVIDLRIYRDRCERSMPPFVRIERRNANEAMHSGLGTEITIRVFADHAESHRLDTRFFSILIIKHLSLEAILLGPSQIHAHEHFSPVLGFGPSCSWVNVYNSVEAVVLTGKQYLRFEVINEGFRLLQMRSELVEHRLAFTRKLHQSLHIIDALRYLPVNVEILFEARALLKDFAGAILIGPEVRFGNLLLQFIELLLLGPCVKETSG